MADLTEEQKKSYWHYNITLDDRSADHLVRRHLSDLGSLGRLAQSILLSGFSPWLLHGGAGLAGDLRYRNRGVRLPDEQARSQIRHPRGGMSYEFS